MDRNKKAVWAKYILRFAAGVRQDFRIPSEQPRAAHGSVCQVRSRLGRDRVPELQNRPLPQVGAGAVRRCEAAEVNARVNIN